jgi:hypothetical protein
MKVNMITNTGFRKEKLIADWTNDNIAQLFNVCHAGLSSRERLVLKAGAESLPKGVVIFSQEEKNTRPRLLSLKNPRRFSPRSFESAIVCFFLVVKNTHRQRRRWRKFKAIQQRTDDEKRQGWYDAPRRLMRECEAPRRTT